MYCGTPSSTAPGPVASLEDEAIAGREHEAPLVAAEIARLIIGRSDGRLRGSAQAQIFFFRQFLGRLLGLRRH